MENIQENLIKISPKDVAQTPLAYALYVVVIVLTSVIVSQRIDASSNLKACEKEKIELQNQVKVERAEKDIVFKAYLVEHSANQQIQKLADSTAIEHYKINRK